MEVTFLSMLKHLQVHTVLREGEQHILTQVHETVHAHYDSVSVYSEEKWGSGLLEAHLSRLFISWGCLLFLSSVSTGWAGWEVHLASCIRSVTCLFWLDCDIKDNGDIDYLLRVCI